MKTKTDNELARGMAEDIVAAMRLDGICYGEDLSDENVVQGIVNDYMDTETAPTRSNYNDNGCTPGVWIFWTPGCRYNIDYPAFDEALLQKTGIDSANEDEEDFYTLKNCKKIFDALNPLYKMAKELVVEMILEDPTVLDD